MSLSPKWLAACVMSCGVGAAQAATQTLSATAFDIRYDDSVVGLYGTPTLLGDSLFFAPGGSPGFTAQTSGGIDVTHSTFSFTITAHPGFMLENFALTESGDYFFFGGTAGVAATGRLSVKPLLPNGAVMTAGVAADSFAANASLDFTPHDWSTGAAIASGPMSVGQVSIQNILSAYADGDFSHAFIEKTHVELAIGVTAVPEPETYALMLAGIGMLGFAARKRVRQGG